MMSDEEISTLREELAAPIYADMSDEEIFSHINRPEEIPNPAGPAQVPAVFSLRDIVEAVDDTRKQIIKQYLNVIAPLVLTQDRAGILAGFDGAVALGDAQASDREAVAAVFARTVPDSAWSPTIPGPSPKQRLFGERTWTTPDGYTVNYITIDDISRARA
jgi:hypothetical protein